MRNNNFFKSLLLLVSILLLASCDKDYNEIGDALIGENHFQLKDTLIAVDATWGKIGPISSSNDPTANPNANNMPINALGVLDNKVFGTTIANFVTQVELTSVNPTIDKDLGQKIDSVILYIPYFTNKDVGSKNGRPVYKLDSIYGNKTAKLNLRIYENNYKIQYSNNDPDYPTLNYTDQNTLADNIKGQWLNNAGNTAQNSQFGFSADEYALKNADGTIAYTAPGMRLQLRNDFFESLLFKDASSATKTNPNLSSNNVFKDYFKGLYFNVEKAGAEDVLAMMNFKRGTIVVYYKEKTSSTIATLVDKSISLNLTGNTVNLLTNDFSSSGIEYNTSPKPDRLYLRGGQGSVAMINLFGTKDVVSYNRTTKKIEAKSNFIPDELDYIKEKGWLINEASLTFYVDQEAMSVLDPDREQEPNRIFLYDVKNKVPVLDYYYDGTTSTAANYAKRVHGGLIEKDANKRGVKYKIRITNYLRDLLNNDERRNFNLAVSVSQAISDINFSRQRDIPTYEVWKWLDYAQKNKYFFPEASVMNPLGTVLYGSSNAVDANKRLRLEIYYTKPN